MESHNDNLSRSQRINKLASWIDQHRTQEVRLPADDGWPDVHSLIHAARKEGMDCNRQTMRQAIVVALFFRKQSENSH